MALGNAHDVIRRIVVTLFGAEERRLEGIIEKLIEQNRRFYPNKPHDGFLYEGKPYDPKGLARGKRTRVTLHVDLVDEMAAYLLDHEKVWTDRLFISQMLLQILHPCVDLQSIRNALPECIVDTLPELQALPRTAVPAYTIKPNNRLYKQYEKLLPRIEFYATMKLFY